jgi:ribosomal 50S subunit-recycling heat shock protein
VNNQPAKAGKELKVGDTLEIHLGSRGVLTCEVEQIPQGGVRKEQAASLYRIISETQPADNELSS